MEPRYTIFHDNGIDHEDRRAQALAEGRVKRGRVWDNVKNRLAKDFSRADNATIINEAGCLGALLPGLVLMLVFGGALSVMFSDAASALVVGVFRGIVVILGGHA